MSNKRGRRSNKIWNHFEEGPKRNTLHKAAICNYCEKNILGISEQMINHLCEYEDADNYADKPFLTYRKKAIYKQIGRVVASANLPFSFVDDPEVKKLFA
ncbi:1639_t:CDS:2, partial [Funneliformis mosseae]